MSQHNLAAYLNDHLAGSTAILDLLDHVCERAADATITGFLGEMRAEIGAERAVLESLMQHLGIARSPTKRLAAWLAEKATRFKLWVEDGDDGTFRLFEVLEAVAVGVGGKTLLWRTLAALAERDAALQRLDYGRLLHRSEEQRQRVETMRLKTGLDALAPVVV